MKILIWKIFEILKFFNMFHHQILHCMVRTYVHWDIAKLSAHAGMWSVQMVR